MSVGKRISPRLIENARVRVSECVGACCERVGKCVCVCVRVSECVGACTWMCLGMCVGQVYQKNK